MKVVLQSLMGVTALYGVYTVAALTAGYIQTRNYKPDFEAAWVISENLPKEVSFGQAPSPFLHGGIFIGAAMVYRNALITKNRR
ncbi:hypothetical protein [Planococcus halotolerans]|uniref:hypothetical protein n=1 Tax=Planococcus halotolerans TaxID=2233542 RepID=UPI0010927DC3|nr:hypothetical protein [Planococcus halotolerans]QHJ69991.1 hypothetical protein DNR44_004980 [Planococcus halotolerans]